MTLRRIIDLFVAMGCSPQEIAGQDVEFGAEWDAYYLACPDGDVIVSLIGFEMDDLVAPSVVEGWERALDVKIPRPNDFN